MPRGAGRQGRSLLLKEPFDLETDSWVRDGLNPISTRVNRPNEFGIILLVLDLEEVMVTTSALAYIRRLDGGGVSADRGFTSVVLSASR